MADAVLRMGWNRVPPYGYDEYDDSNTCDDKLIDLWRKMMAEDGVSTRDDFLLYCRHRFLGHRL